MIVKKYNEEGTEVWGHILRAGGMERDCLLGSIEQKREEQEEWKGVACWGVLREVEQEEDKERNIWRPLWKALTEIGKPLTWTGWQTEERLDAH